MLVEERSVTIHVPRNLSLSTLYGQIPSINKGTDAVTFLQKFTTRYFIFNVFKTRLFSKLHAPNPSISLLESATSIHEMSPTPVGSLANNDRVGGMDRGTNSSIVGEQKKAEYTSL